MPDYRIYIALALVLVLTIPSVDTDWMQNTTFEAESPSVPSYIYGSDIAREVYEAVSVRSYKEYVKGLSELGPRPVGSINNEYAKDWIIDKLDQVSNGRIEAVKMGPSESIIGKMSGTLGSAGPSIVVGGHFDSVDGAPGANDDASGVAVAIELARVLSKYTFPVNIYFCAWNAEEIGLVGSDEVARIFRKEEIDILVYFNIDMLLYPDSGALQSEKVILGYDSSARYHASEMWSNLVRAMNYNYGELMTVQMPSSGISFWRRSDHYSFISYGYRGVLYVFESGTGSDSDYHKPTDTWDNPAYDYNIASEAVAAMGASIAFVAKGTHEQRIHERHDSYIAMNAKQRYLVEITTSTNITVTTSWGGQGDVDIAIVDPSGQPITMDSEQIQDNSIEASFQTPIIGTYTVIVQNQLGVSSQYEIELEYDSDIEGNGIRDKNEQWKNSFYEDYDDDGISDADDPNEYVDLTQIDTDNDSISDYDEMYIYHTDPESSDSDKDSIPDLWEIQRGLDPNENDAKSDYDFDCLINAYEYLARTNPFNRDTDQDQMYDGWEWQYGLNPLVDDSEEDLDGDGWSNIYELQHGHNPTVPDSALLKILPTLQIYGLIGLVFVIVVLIRKY